MRLSVHKELTPENLARNRRRPKRLFPPPFITLVVAIILLFSQALPAQTPENLKECDIHRAPSRPKGICSNFPYRSANVGSTRRLRAVEVTSPPRMMIAIGPSISRPGAPLPIANGNK